MKICTSARINDALIEIEDLEERDPENRFIVVWRNKDEENRYSARSLEEAEEYYQYRCRLAEQRRILNGRGSPNQIDFEGRERSAPILGILCETRFVAVFLAEWLSSILGVRIDSSGGYSIRIRAEAHHTTVTFQDEYRAFLKRHHVSFDGR